MRPDPDSARHARRLRMPGRRRIDVYQVGREGDLIKWVSNWREGQVAIAVHLIAIDLPYPGHTQTSSMYRATRNWSRCRRRHQVSGFITSDIADTGHSYTS